MKKQRQRRKEEWRREEEPRQRAARDWQTVNQTRQGWARDRKQEEVQYLWDESWENAGNERVRDNLNEDEDEDEEYDEGENEDKSGVAVGVDEVMGRRGAGGEVKETMNC